MHQVLQVLRTAGLAVVAYGIFNFLRWAYRNWTSPLRQLRGPKSTNLIFGNIREIRKADNAVLHEQWVEEHGTVITYAGLLGSPRLYTTDLQALRYVFNNSQTYQKPEMARAALSQLLGDGLVVAEGEVHKRQRRVMNPAFAPAQVRAATDVMLDKATKLTDLWATQVEQAGGSTTLNVLSGIGRAALDVIGVAGFDYEINALDEEKPSELSKVFNDIFIFDNSIPLLEILRVLVPPLQAIIHTSRSRNVQRAVEIMAGIGKNLVSRTRAEVGDGKTVSADQSVDRRDLLSLLMRYNLSPTLPEAHKLTDQEVISQIPTFLVAGHETTSTATSYALFALSEHQSIQDQLRKELLSIPDAHPTMDQLDSLPFLDSVVRETLRLHPPVPNTLRNCTQDDLIPVGTPYTDKDGNLQKFIKVQKGNTIFVPIMAINRSKAIFGPDAFEFSPSRWANLPAAASGIPGMLNMMSFLGGPRACIGYRFSVMEIKVFLFTFLRAFEFELAVPASEIKKQMSGAVHRPMIKSDPEAGSQLPLIVRRR
ncbi:cytochrome P450 [Pterulicium gracile]|uniref:Cytochrome P450 n=1 Tax=Pterulicium gracile TaxID=1884261 RepID=A0A5C3R1K5_9AGAR|nr:cytochrome P450 [Pterula gracilis]